MIKETAVKMVFEKSMKLRPNESCLIVTDTIKEQIARPFFSYASRMCSKSDI